MDNNLNNDINSRKKINVFYLIFLSINILLAVIQLILSYIIRDDNCNGYVCQKADITIKASAFMNHYLNLFLVIGVIFIIYSIFYLIFKIKNKASIGMIIFIIIGLFLTPVTQFGYEIIKFAPSHNEDMTYYKPMIYIYPKEDATNVKIKLSNSGMITCSYPKYDNEWNVSVSKDGNIYDFKTKRNYYGLYWEGTDNSRVDKTEGFVIKGKETSKFLEEKLEILGLNEREINEFIVYWLPKLENNKYNYIRFRTTEEINNYMRIETNVEVDSLIRVYMDYKPLDKQIKVREQELIKRTRQGFTIVEWGGRELL